MRRHSIPVFLAVALALACGGGSSKTRDPYVAQPVAGSVLGNVGFLQFVPLGNDTGAAFAGSANEWDLQRDLSLSDGWDDQFDGAIRIRVGTLASPKPATWSEMNTAASGLTTFPYDQTYAELTFYDPAFAAPTLKAAAATNGSDGMWVLAGTWSAALAPAADSRLEQVVNLTAATGTITLTWQDDAYTYSPFTDAGRRYAVVVRNPADRALLATALEATSASGAHSFDLSSFAGSSVLLSFELRAMGWSYGLVDSVSVSDGTNEYVTNGGFEAGNLSGWTTYAGSQSQNVVGGMRTLDGLDVTRGFYTSPGSTWARWVDVFSNAGASAVTRDVVYYTNLGSDGYGIIYGTPGANGRALTSWDGGTGDRDVAIVYGNGQAFFSSATALNSYTGSDSVYVLHTITVPAGGKVAIVQYVVMDGNDTSLLATTVDTTAKATNVDGIAAGIVGNFGKDPVYMDYMTADQRAATIANW